jgi:hypothetical protein
MDKTFQNINHLKQEASIAKEIISNLQNVNSTDNAYATFYGSFHLIKQYKDMAKEIKLCNFIAEIDEEITKTDGINYQKFFRISGRLETGQPLTEIDIPAENFEKMDWLTPSWGAAAYISVGTKHKEHVVTAIKTLSKPTKVEVATHTGWIGNGKNFGFLSASGVINKDGLDKSVRADLNGVLGDYSLPDPNLKHDYDLNDVLNLISNVLNNNMGLIPLGGAFRAVLSHFSPAKVSIYLQGTTGTFKSALAGCYQSFFGKKFNNFHFPENWTSTGNAIEKKAFLSKDVLFVVDDFVARGTQVDVSRLHQSAERVLRAQGNQSGRDRLTSQAEVKGAFHPRGLILATGEDTPNGHSLQARMILISIEKGQVDTSILSKLQHHGDNANLSHIMSQFIQWIAIKSSNNELNDLLAQLEEKYIEIFKNTGHTRMPNNLSSILVGLGAFSKYITETNKVTEIAANKLMEKAINAASILARFQSDANKEASDANRFLSLVSTAVSAGKGHIAAKDGGEPNNATSLGWKTIGTGTNKRLDGQGPCIGWVDDNDLYLELKSSLSTIKTFSSSLGHYFGSTERAVGKALREANYLVNFDQDRNTTKITVAGLRKHLLHLKTSDVFDLSSDCFETKGLFDEEPNNFDYEEVPF